jgi:hypothetical protein
MTYHDLASRRGLLVLFATFFLVGYALPTIVAVFVAQRGVQVEVDAKIESGRIVELYVNGYRREPMTVPITPGVRRTYAFAHIIENVNFLRIDLGKISGVSVEVYGITVSVGGKVARQYGPDVIYQWAQAQPAMLSGPAVKAGDHVAYVQKVYGPSLIISDVFAGGVPTALRVLLPQDRDGIVIGFWAALLIMVALARPPLWARGETLLILLGVPAIAMLAVRVAYALPNRPDSVDQAVGMAGFRSLSLVPNRAVAIVTLLAALVLSAALIVVARRWRRRGVDLAPPPATPPAVDFEFARYRHTLGVIAVVAVALVIASLSFADVYTRIAVHSQLPFTNDWDANNVNLWSYLVFHGLRPLRDFWFPYGGTWVFSLPPPWGPLWDAGMRAAVYVTCFLALVRLCGVIPAILIIYLVLVCDRIQLMWAPSRYLLGANIALAYVAIGEIRARFTAGHLLFGVALSLALFFEPVQALYAAPAVLAVLLLDLFQRKTAFGWDLVRRLLAELGIPLAYLVIYFGLISDTGELRATVAFLLTLGPHAYSSAIPTDLAKEIDWPFGVGLLLLTMPSALIGIGLYRRLAGTARAPALDTVLIALGIVGFMYFQKHLVRPVEWQFTTPTLLAMLIWLIADPMFRRIRTAVVGGAAAGILFWSLDLTGAPGAIVRQTIAAPRNAFHSLAAVIQSPDVVAKARENFYAPQRFEAFPNFNKVVARLRALGGGEIPRPVYVIGDLPMLYALLGQTPPFNTNDFNTSPIFEQRRVIDWIVQKRPRYAVWNASDLQSDAFQRTVRVPLLYGLDAATFVPVETVGELTILRHRADGEPPALAWWRERLSDTVDLGGLPRRTSFFRLPECPDAPALDRCTPFLQVMVPPELRTQPRLAVTVAVGDLTFRIAFAPTPRNESYFLRLNRLWFWDAAQLAQLPFRIVGPDNPSVRVILVTKAPDDRTLY